MTRTTSHTTSGGGASRRAWRWRVRLGVLLLLIAVCAAVYAPAPAQAQPGGYSVPWWTADSGGGGGSGGGYSLRGTIGQPDAAVGAAGGYTLHGGFWRTAPLQPLAIQPLANQTAQVGSTVSLPVIVTNPAGGALQFSAVGLPPDLLIDPATGLISGTLAAGSAGVHTVTITVTNERGVSAQMTFTFTVTAPTDLDEQPEPNLLPSLYLPLVSN